MDGKLFDKFFINVLVRVFYNDKAKTLWDEFVEHLNKKKLNLTHDIFSKKKIFYDHACVDRNGNFTEIYLATGTYSKDLIDKIIKNAPVWKPEFKKVYKKLIKPLPDPLSSNKTKNHSHLMDSLKIFANVYKSPKLSLIAQPIHNQFLLAEIK